MPQKDKGGMFVKFPLDDEYVGALQAWKQELKQKGELISLREILEREIIKLDRTRGIREALQLDQAPLIFDAPTNSVRVPVRLKNQQVIDAVNEASKTSQRSISKVLYTLVRISLDDSAHAPFAKPGQRKVG